jgi:hypothetical protein
VPDLPLHHLLASYFVRIFAVFIAYRVLRPCSRAASALRGALLRQHFASIVRCANIVFTEYVASERRRGSWRLYLKKPTTQLAPQPAALQLPNSGLPFDVSAALLSICQLAFATPEFLNWVTDAIQTRNITFEQQPVPYATGHPRYSDAHAENPVPVNRRRITAVYGNVRRHKRTSCPDSHPFLLLLELFFFHVLFLFFLFLIVLTFLSSHRAPSPLVDRAALLPIG